MKRHLTLLWGILMGNEVPIPSGLDLYWEKWEDPYNQEMMAQQFEEADDGEHNPFDDLAKFKMPIKTMMTPFGLMPLTEQSLASNHFKFWVGHTNFALTPQHMKIIESCLGVETLEPISPLRFKVGIGKLFKDREVMSQIREHLLQYEKRTG